MPSINAKAVLMVRLMSCVGEPYLRLLKRGGDSERENIELKRWGKKGLQSSARQGNALEERRSHSGAMTASVSCVLVGMVELVPSGAAVTAAVDRTEPVCPVAEPAFGTSPSFTCSRSGVLGKDVRGFRIWHLNSLRPYLR